MKSIRMKSIPLLVVLTCVCASAALPPLPLDVSLRFALDPDSSDDSQVSTGLWVGYKHTPELIAGLYGTYQTTDRKVPSNMDYVFGAGFFGEYHPDLGDTLLQPYLGVGVGFLDPNGIDGSTMVHLQTSAGARLYMTTEWYVSTAVTFHWAQKRFFDSKPGGQGASADRTDLTFDVGIGFSF